jgi:predicted nucleic acid-binding protein
MGCAGEPFCQRTDFRRDTARIELLAPGAKRERLESWLNSDLRQWFGNRLLPVKERIANRWGTLAAEARRRGLPVATIDGLLATTAFEHGLSVATRDARDFEGTGLAIVNPGSSHDSARNDRKPLIN